MKTEIPDLKKAWEMLEYWLSSHGNARAISPFAILQFAKRRWDVDTEDGLNLILALEVLTEQGRLRRRFAVQSPSGSILYPYYPTRSSIPKRVRGAAEEWLDTADAEIRPIFVGVSDNE